MTDAILPRIGDAALLIIDAQGPVLDRVGAPADGLVRNANWLLRVWTHRGWPTLYSEHAPGHFGPVSTRLQDALSQSGAARFEKTTFSLARDTHFAENAMRKLPNHIVVCGAETHICVLHTVADLQNRGYQCFVPFDAVASWDPALHANGLALIDAAGGTVINTESLVYHVIGDAAAADAATLVTPPEG